MISVVVPVYRAERFVGEAVESVLAQPEVSELLLVEDGSPDGSLAVCEAWAARDGRVRLLRHPGGGNRGAGATRNLGIEAAAGSYVAFLDADDRYLPRRFARDLAILERSAETDGVHGVLGIVWHEGEPGAGRGREGVDALTRVEPGVPPEALFEALAPLGKRGHFHLNTLTLRKRVFARSGLFAEDLELSQDSHLCLRLAAVGRLVESGGSEPVALRGMHAGNRVRDREKLFRLRPRLFGSLFEWSVRAGLPRRRRFLLWEAYYRFHYAQPDAARAGGGRAEFFRRAAALDPALRLAPGWWRRRLLGAWTKRERAGGGAGPEHRG